MPESERATASGASGAITPSRLNELIRAAIDRSIPSTLHVVGEVGDLTRAGSGHLYFTLKDANAEIRCVMWRSASAKLKFVPASGLEVIATGGLEVYPPRGAVQLTVRKLEPRGIGALELAFRQLFERLETEGLFDPARKRPLPAFPQRIAVVTSPTGAALRDILQTLARRYPVADILVYPVRVQGDGAAAEIAAALRSISARAPDIGGVDAIIVGRGGGSLEDLWAFNEEVVARAIAECAVPVISAVGHEVDISVSDLVADVRAATPTAAAEIVAPQLADVLAAIDIRCAQAARVLRQRLEVAGHALRLRAEREVFARPERRFRERVQWLDESMLRLRGLLVDHLRDARRRLTGDEAAIVQFGAGAAFARLARRVDERAHRCGQLTAQAFGEARARIDIHERRILRRHPDARLARGDERLQQTLQRAARAMLVRLRESVQNFRTQVDRLTACDPQRILARGYSITRDARTRRIVRCVEEIRDKQRLITQLANGEFRATADDPRQPGLFDEAE